MRRDLLSLIIDMCGRRDGGVFTVNDYLRILQAADQPSPLVDVVPKPRLPIGSSRERPQRKDVAVHALRLSAVALRHVAQRGRAGIETYLAKGGAPYGTLVDRVLRGCSGIARKRRRHYRMVAPMVMDPPRRAMPAWAIQERRNISANADDVEHARACYHERFSNCRDHLRSERTGHGRRRDRTERYAQDVRLSPHARIVAANGVEQSLLDNGGYMAAMCASWQGPIGGYRDPIAHIPIGFPPGRRPTAQDMRIIAVRLMFHLGMDPAHHAFVVVEHRDKLANDDRMDAHLVVARTRDDGRIWGLPSHWHAPTCQLAAWLVADEAGLGGEHRTDAIARSSPWDLKYREFWRRGRESGPHGRAIAARLLSRDSGAQRQDVTLLDQRAMRRVAVGIGSASVSSDGAVFFAKLAPLSDDTDLESYLSK